MEVYQYADVSFRDFMDAAKDAAATRPSRLRPVRRERVVWLTCADLAARWGCSTTRVKILCETKRVRARRSRTGKGRPWRIAGIWDGTEYAVTVKPAAKGPSLRFQPKETVPF